MIRILVLFAHPALEKSRVNKVLLKPILDLPGITVHDLYEQYPGYDIDVAVEQAKLVEHDVFVFHHPMYWYSTPALLKEWQDLVLAHGWAYGVHGEALRGKRMFQVVTTGGGADAYAPGGFQGHTLEEFYRPIERTMWLCGVDYLPPFVVHGTHGMTPDRARAHATDYRKLLEAVRDDRLDVAAVRKHPRINHNLDAVIAG